MPVLHYPPIIGGFEVFSQSVAERIGKTDDVFVITSKVLGVVNNETKNRLKIFRTSLFALKDLSYSKPWYILTAMIWIFFKSLYLIKKEKIDLIHAQGFLSGIIGYFLYKFTKKPYVITIQSADFSVYHPRLNINIIKIVYKKFERAIFENAKICHAVSKYLEKHFKNYNVKKTIIIPNGVSQDFKPDQNKSQTRKELGFDTENLICCVSRLEHKNGTHDLIEAAKYLSGDFKIIIIGSGSQKQQLEKLIKELNLQDKVLLLGDMVYARIPKYVASADIFVRPSLAEGFGIVFLEAMAVNVAVIGTPVGGIPDFLKSPSTDSGQAANGLFCKPGNPKDIAEKIKLLIENKELQKKLVKNAKKMVDEIYNWDKISEQIRNIYIESIK